jgi:hypothetical protein
VGAGRGGADARVSGWGVAGYEAGSCRSRPVAARREALREAGVGGRSAEVGEVRYAGCFGACKPYSAVRREAARGEELGGTGRGGDKGRRSEGEGRGNGTRPERQKAPAEPHNRTDSHAPAWLASLRSVPPFSGRCRAETGARPTPHAEGGDPATLPGGAARVAGRWLLCFRESSRAPGAGEEPNPARCAVLVVSAATWLNRVSFAFHDQSSPGPARAARDDRRLRCGAALVDGREGGWRRERGREVLRVFQIQKNPVEGAELPVGLLCCLLR